MENWIKGNEKGLHNKSIGTAEGNKEFKIAHAGFKSTQSHYSFPISFEWLLKIY